MTRDYDSQIASFIAEGNQVIGRPKEIVGNFSIPEYKSGSKIVFGKNVIVRDTIVHFPLGGGELVLGDDVSICAWIHLSQKSFIKIGSGTNFNRHCELHAWEGASIEIGSDCLLSNIKVRTSDMHSIFEIETHNRVNRSKSVSIGNKVWIGEFSVVGKGSRICDGSVVGSNSFVSGYIPPRSIAVGQPARVKKQGIYWSTHLDTADPVALPPAESASTINLANQKEALIQSHHNSSDKNHSNKILIDKSTIDLLKALAEEIHNSYNSGNKYFTEELITKLRKSIDKLY